MKLVLIITCLFLFDPSFAGTKQKKRTIFSKPEQQASLNRLAKLRSGLGTTFRGEGGIVDGGGTAHDLDNEGFFISHEEFTKAINNNELITIPLPLNEDLVTASARFKSYFDFYVTSALVRYRQLLLMGYQFKKSSVNNFKTWEKLFTVWQSLTPNTFDLYSSVSLHGRASISYIFCEKTTWWDFFTFD